MSNDAQIQGSGYGPFQAMGHTMFAHSQRVRTKGRARYHYGSAFYRFYPIPTDWVNNIR